MKYFCSGHIRKIHQLNCMCKNTSFGKTPNKKTRKKNKQKTNRILKKIVSEGEQEYVFVIQSLTGPQFTSISS